MYKIKELVDLILEVDTTANINSVLRCINKSNIIVWYDGVYLVADDEMIYYFGAKKESRVPSKLGAFVKNNTHLAAGKKYYSKNNEAFKRKSKHIKENLYTWASRSDVK